MRYRLRTLLILLAAGPPLLAGARCVSVMGALCTSECSAGEPADTNSLISRLIEHGPIFDGDRYKCADMVWAVNELRKAGKSEAIRALREFIAKTASGEDIPRRDSVFLICRCLFDKPGGWPLPKLGEPSPDIQESALKKLPLFPLASSDGVPFMLISGYRLGGRGEDPRECIKLCESLSMRSADLPTQGFEAAAKALVESASFAELYPDAETRKELSEMILKQAREDKE